MVDTSGTMVTMTHQSAPLKSSRRSVYLDDEMWAELGARAREHGSSTNWSVRQAVAAYLRGPGIIAPNISDAEPHDDPPPRGMSDATIAPDTSVRFGAPRPALKAARRKR